MWLLACNPGRWAPSGLSRALREAVSGHTLPPKPKSPRRRRCCWRLLGSALYLPPLGRGPALPPPLGRGPALPPPLGRGPALPPPLGRGPALPPPLGRGPALPPPLGRGPALPPPLGRGPALPPPLGRGPALPPPLGRGPALPPPLGRGPALPPPLGRGPALPPPLGRGPALPPPLGRGPALPPPLGRGPALPPPLGRGPALPPPLGRGPALPPPLGRGPALPPPLGRGPALPPPLGRGPALPPPLGRGPALPPPLGRGPALPPPLRHRLRDPPLALWGRLTAARGYGAGKPAARRKEAVAEGPGPGPDPGSRCGHRPGTEQHSTDRLSVDTAGGGGSAELYENPWTIPNLLCVARISLSPYLGYLIVHEKFNLALGLFALAGVTDLLDGFIARNWASQKSALGSALDPLADKILISVLYISLTCAGLIPGSLTAIILFRDAALIAAVFYVRYQTVPPPRTLSKYFNPCYATAQLKPTFISKVNTAVQLVLVAASLAAPVFHYVDSAFLQTLWYITALTTTGSAYSYYLYGRNTVQVLKRGKK